MHAHIYGCLHSLKPDISDDKASATKAKKAILIEAAEESVNMLSTPSRMRFVIGIAADNEDISRYAVT